MSAAKTCTHCGRTLPLESFNRRKDSKDGLNQQCRDCVKRRNAENYRRMKAERHRKREGVTNRPGTMIAALSSYLASVDEGKPHSVSWWRQTARDGGFPWAGYADVRAALAQAGIEPFDLRSRNLYAVADDYGRSGARKTGKRKSTYRNSERHRRADESAPYGHHERKEGAAWRG